MKKVNLLFVTLLAFLMVSTVIANDGEKNWNAFSVNLIKAFNSENDGLKESALQMIIEYSDKVWVHDASNDIYDIYRNHESFNMRRLAMVALYKIKTKWFVDQLMDDLKTEKNVVLRSQMVTMVQEYYKEKSSKEESYMVIVK